jgi:hypothetical protein
MSQSRMGELDSALRERLVICKPAESLAVIARHLGQILATVPGKRREVVRAVFNHAVDSAVADHAAPDKIRSV